MTKATPEQIHGEAEAGMSHSRMFPSKQTPEAESKQERDSSRARGSWVPPPPSEPASSCSLSGAEAPPGLRLTGTSCPTGCFHGNEGGLATSPSFKRATCLQKARPAALSLLPFRISSLRMRCAGQLTSAGKADPVLCPPAPLRACHVTVGRMVSLSGP